MYYVFCVTSWTHKKFSNLVQRNVGSRSWWSLKLILTYRDTLVSEWFSVILIKKDLTDIFVAGLGYFQVQSNMEIVNHSIVNFMEIH